MIRIVFNRLLGGWYIVRGPHQSPIGGRFESKAAAETWLAIRSATGSAWIASRATKR